MGQNPPPPGAQGQGQGRAGGHAQMDRRRPHARALGAHLLVCLLHGKRCQAAVRVCQDDPPHRVV